MKALVYVVGVALLPQYGVNVYSVEKEHGLRQQLASEIRSQSTPFADAAVAAYVQRISRELVTQIQDARLPYQFQVISGVEWTEPRSLPGGYVFIPARSFLAAQDEGEFVGMVAHAIGHVALRHGTRTATQRQVANMAGMPFVFGGGWAGSHADAQRPQTAVPMGFLEFQRTYELEADRFGLELAARAGYDAAAFRRYIERVQAPDSKTSPLPARELRLARLRETLFSLPSTAPVSSGEEFRRVREAVRLTEPAERRRPTLRR